MGQKSGFLSREKRFKTNALTFCHQSVGLCIPKQKNLLNQSIKT